MGDREKTRLGDRRAIFSADLPLRLAAGSTLMVLALATAWVGGFLFLAFWLAASEIVVWEWQRLGGGGRIPVSGVLARRFGDRGLGMAATGRRRAHVGSRHRRRARASRRFAPRSPRRGDQGVSRGPRRCDSDRGARRSAAAGVGGRGRSLCRGAGRRRQSPAREPGLWPARDSLAFRRRMGHGRLGLFRRALDRRLQTL